MKKELKLSNYDCLDAVEDNTQTNKISFYKLTFLIGVFLLILFIESLIREPLFNFSLTLIKSLREEYPDKNNNFYFLSKILAAIPRDIILVVISLITYNYFNIFKAYIMFTLIFYRKIVVNLLKLYYQSPRPFWYDEKLSYGEKVELGYGNPSGHSFTSMLFCLFIYEIWINSNLKLDDRKWIKRISFSLLFILACLIAISRVYLGAHAINQIIFGLTLAIFSYYIFFYVIFSTKDINNPVVYSEIISNKHFLTKIVIMCIGLCVLFTVSFCLLYNSEKEKEVIIRLKFDNYPFYRLLSYDALFNLFYSINFLGVSLGLLFDFKFNYYNDVKLLEKNTFEIDEVCESKSLNGENVIENEECEVFNDNDNHSQLEQNNVNKNVPWNNTVWYLSLARLILMVGLYYVMSFGIHAIDISNNVILLILFKEILPYTVFYFIILGPMKGLFEVLCLCSK